jgi:N-acetyl-anhydromuramyl-L-alanine amidase AmpD
MSCAILVDGREVGCEAVVRANAHLKFSALGKRAETRMALWHWTGGVGRAPQVFRTLQERRLSVHFLIEPEGVIWQYADAMLRCSHAGVANGFSVGIEITNPATRLDVEDGLKRQVLADEVHGKRIRYQGFTDAQVKSARALARSLSLAFGLPLDVPRNADGSIIRRLLTKPESDDFRGHAGHYHFSLAKTDPGPCFLESIVPLRGRLQ